MPPFVARKRHREEISDTEDARPSKRATKTPPRKKKQPTLFDTADATPKTAHSLEDNQKYLQSIDVNDDEEDEALSDLNSDDFEDALPSASEHRRKGEPTEEEDDEHEMDWEDAIPEAQSSSHAQAEVSGDLELTLNRFPTHTMASLSAQAGAKKGPSKIERFIRVNTHCMHVQCLLAHNYVRNNWACDEEVQKILTRTLGSGIKKEIEKWKFACGDKLESYNSTIAQKLKNGNDANSMKGKGKVNKNSKSHQNQRDWGKKADHVRASPSSSGRADPTLRLLKVLSSYWKKRFAVTTPGLRKQGYKDLVRLEEEVRAYRTDPNDHEQHGERIKGLAAFRKLAEKCQGSRDAGAQLFTALLRGVGFETRLVANLLVVGFGWSKIEDAHPSKKSPLHHKDHTRSVSAAGSDTDRSIIVTKQSSAHIAKAKTTGSRRNTTGKRDEPIDLSADESPLSSAPSSDAEDDMKEEDDMSDDASLVDVTPVIPRTMSKKQDRDLMFPHYWVEVLSPISNTWIAVDPLVLSIIANDAEKMSLFEPRGAKADKAKQVIAYVVAYSSDRTAKDVTVRYLKRQMWPGKTKGVRMPAEKIPIYNKRGKVLRYEDYDWFAQVMQSYNRPPQLQTRADELEEENELKPVRVVREPKVGGDDTLQGYKNSAEFVLERHLRREEALLPGSKHIRMFSSGKGDKAKTEPVYRRKDVVACKTIESWHKEGRAVKPGEQPLKHVPMRAVTLMRKREIEEAERETGEKMKQALYSRAQTDWIIPPPIVNGVIPKNAFGNMDVYVPTMVPKGAVHVRLRGTAKMCKKLGIDFAEACTGFEFGNKRAVPVLTGVVVAKENEGAVRDAWRIEQEEKRKRESAKREKIALGMWKKMLAGLRIVERVRKEYGDDAESHIQEAVQAKVAKGKNGKKTKSGANTHEAIDLEDTDVDASHVATEHHHGGGLVNDDESDVGGGFLMDDEYEDPLKHEMGGFTLQDESSKQSAHADLEDTEARVGNSDGEDFKDEHEDEDVDDDDDEPIMPKAAPSAKRKTSPTAVRAATSKRTPLCNAKTNIKSTATTATTAATKRTRTTKGVKASKKDGVASSGNKRRNASRKSTEGVRSRYFVGDSDSEGQGEGLGDEFDVGLDINDMEDKE